MGEKGCASKWVRHSRVVCLLLALLLPYASAVTPTTELPPAPSATVAQAVRYPPVPIEGSPWANTVRKREVAARRMVACVQGQRKGKAPPDGCGKQPGGSKGR